MVDARDGTQLDADAVVEGLALRRPGTTEDTLTAPRLDILIRELRQRPGATALRYASLGGDVTVLDPTQTPPRPLTFSDLTVTADGLEQPMKGPAQIAVHANVPGGGEVDVTGTAGAVPRRADLRVRARGLELSALARHLPLAGRLGGTATADLRVIATHDGTLGLTVTGDATLDRVALGDGSRTLAGATRIRAGALEYRWPATVAIGQLTVTQPAVTVERAADGSISLASLLRAPAAPGDAGPATTTPAATPDVRIVALKLDDGRAVVTDAASGTRVEVTRLTTRARDLAWPGREPVPIELAAVVAGADVSAHGTIDVAQRQADLNVGLRGVDLATLQPWLPIAGRVRGALSRGDLRVHGRQAEALTLTVTGNATLERPRPRRWLPPARERRARGRHRSRVHVAHHRARRRPHGHPAVDDGRARRRGRAEPHRAPAAHRVGPCRGGRGRHRAAGAGRHDHAAPDRRRPRDRRRRGVRRQRPDRGHRVHRPRRHLARPRHVQRPPRGHRGGRPGDRARHGGRRAEER